ncbi:MAG: GNAT family N-acetyltransferase [Eubacterium sp.]|nr:GNAT family N-acetyltransferase [Eubacterium sp.]
MGNIRLVKIKKCEIFKAWRLQRKGFRETLEKYQDYKTSPATEGFIKFYHKFVNKAADNYRVLYNGKTAGALCIVLKPDCIWLGRFYILPEYRNKGIGQQALILAEHLYPAALRWRLDTILEEKNNIHLYEKLGYKEYGERKRINNKMTIVNYEKEIE